MKKTYKIALAVIIVLSMAVDSYAESNLDRVRAVESLSYFVESRFPQLRMQREELSGGFSNGVIGEPDLKAISATVGSIINDTARCAGRLWIHRELYNSVKRWDGLGGRIARCDIIGYDNISQLIAGIDPELDIALVDIKDLEKLALMEGHGLDNAVLLSFGNARLEYMDQIAVSLILIRELRHRLQEIERQEILEIPEFHALKALLASLMVERNSFPDEDVMNIIPGPGLPFARRALTILQHSIRPMQKEDLKKIRAIQSAVRGV